MNSEPNRYNRNIEELEARAAHFWPIELSKQEAELSIIPILLRTQEQFIAILSVDVPTHEELFQIVNSSTLSANLFVKHLSVLADVGGEKLQRYNREFGRLFPEGELEYLRNGKLYRYRFSQLPVSGTLNNSKLGIAGRNLFTERLLDGLLKDVAVLLMYGSACTNSDTAEILAKCEVGSYLGDQEKLRTYVRQRYIWVSRITGGAQSNTLGQIAQTFVKQYLQERLPDYDFGRSRIPGITHSEGKDTSFDVVVTNSVRYVAIEVSFQETTNSVIERKAGQAKDRFEQVEAKGYKIAYVIDGAGNFQRANAVSTICKYSHCTVAFTVQELNVLIRFIESYLEGSL